MAEEEILYYECRKVICKRRCGGRVSEMLMDSIRIPFRDLPCPKCKVGTWAEMKPVFKKEKKNNGVERR